MGSVLGQEGPVVVLLCPMSLLYLSLQRKGIQKVACRLKEVSDIRALLRYSTSRLQQPFPAWPLSACKCRRHFEGGRLEADGTGRGDWCSLERSLALVMQEAEAQSNQAER